VVEGFAPYQVWSLSDIFTFVEAQRRRTGVTVARLCEDAGYTEATYYRWRKKPSSVHAETAVCFLRAVGYALTLQPRQG
jgi:hypothetical protein